MSGYLVGIDIGGTFTDCAIVDRAGKLLTTKVPSTPQDFSRGMMDALETGARALDLPLANPIVGDPARFIDPKPQFRQFCCPGVGCLWRTR